MGRKQPPKGQIIPKMQEKLAAVDAAMSARRPEGHVAKFKEMFPTDWNRVVRRYEQHQEANPGRGHPMPEPDTYLLNMVKNYLKKLQE